MRWRSSLVPRLGVCLLSVVALAAGANAQDPVPEDFAVALGLLQRGLHDEAAPYLTRFLERQPEHGRAREAWYRLGTCQQRAGSAQDAVASFRKALSGRGAFALQAEARYRLGGLLHAAADHQAGREQFEALLREVPADHYLVAGARYGLGECLRDQGDDAAAAAAFVQTLEVAKGDQASFAFPAAYQAGFARLRLEQMGDAADLFRAARGVAPDAAATCECHYLEGDAALRAGQLPRAAQSFAEAIRAGGAFADDACLGLGFCRLEEGDTDAALRQFQALAANFPRSELVPQGRLEAGRLLYQKGEAEAARAELSRLLAVESLDPTLRGAGLELRGLAALDAGAAEQAAKDFAAALPTAGDAATTARIRYGQGEAALEQQDWETAAGHFAAAAGDGADNGVRGDALYGHSLALHKLGQFADSRQLAETLLRELPQHRLATLARFSVAENHFAEKAFARADKAYQGIPSDHELSDKAVFKRGWCAYLAGDKQLAAERFQAMARGGDGALADAELREEALSMCALASLEADNPDGALQAADQYRSRHGDGRFLARTERVAARVLRARGELEAAAVRMAAASKAAGNEGEAAADTLERAELVYQQGDFQGAAEVYAQLSRRRDATGARALEGQAWCMFELGDDERCAQLIAAGKRHPEIGDNRAGLLQLEYALHHRAGRWDDAATAAGAFLGDFADHPRAAEMRYSLGVAQARGDKLQEARKTLEAAAADASTPRLDRVWYELAWTRRKLDDEQAALAAFAKVAELSEDADLKGEAELHLGVAGLEGDADPATVRKLLSNVQGVYRGRALYRLGFAAFENAQWQPALAAFTDLVAVGPEDPLHLEGVHMVGACQYELGEYQVAAGQFRKLLAGDAAHPRAPDARLMLGECAVRLGRPGEAVEPLGRFLAQADDDTAKVSRARAHLWLGRARQGQKQFDQAEQQFVEVTRLSEGPLAAEAQYRIGESRAARRDLEGAADAYVKLPILYAHAEWVRKGLLQAGITYAQLEQPAKARRFFEELIQRHADSDEAKDAQQRLRAL